MWKTQWRIFKYLEESPGKDFRSSPNKLKNNFIHLFCSIYKTISDVASPKLSLKFTKIKLGCFLLFVAYTHREKVRLLSLLGFNLTQSGWAHQESLWAISPFLSFSVTTESLFSSLPSVFLSLKFPAGFLKVWVAPLHILDKAGWQLLVTTEETEFLKQKWQMCFPLSFRPKAPGQEKQDKNLGPKTTAMHATLPGSFSRSDVT